MTIYQIKNRSGWYINITRDGVRLNQKVGDTKKEALQAEAEIITKHRLKQLHLEDIKKDCPSFFRIATEYLKHVKITKSPRTFELEYTDYKKQLDPFFGHITADHINIDLLQQFQQKQKKLSLNPMLIAQLIFTWV